MRSLFTSALGWELFGLALLAVGLLVLVVAGVVLIVRALRARRRGVSDDQVVAALCPACGRAWPPGVRYCPADGAHLEVVAAATSAPEGGLCPSCHRAFEAGVRFCPIDRDPLVPLPARPDERGAEDGPDFADHLLTGDGKICPLCGARYDLACDFCGRDAAELMTLN